MTIVKFSTPRSTTTWLHRFVWHRVQSTLSPQEAGQRAAELAQRRLEGDKKTSPLCMDTHLSHAGVVSSIPNAPMSPPLHLSTTYTRPADGIYLGTDTIYSREDCPTRLLLEAEMAALECLPADGDDDVDTSGVISCAFSSGMMAASSIVLAHQTPIKIILAKDLYHGVPTVLHEVFSRFHVEIETVDLLDSAALETALRSVSDGNDVIVWLETPSNPLCHVIDIQATSQFVRSLRPDATVVVDSTLAPPVMTQPLKLGADMVMHSATKYLGGHSDALLGVVTASPWTDQGRHLGPRLRTVQTKVGGVASVMDSWLVLRGLRTLSVRMEMQCTSALQVSSFLERHSSVYAVHYPGLESHPQHSTATKQMAGGYGGVLSVDMETEVRAMALAGALQTIQRATSLGGTETVIEHRASIEPPNRRTSPPGLLRMSVGLEDSSDLVDDLDNALDVMEEVLST